MFKHWCTTGHGQLFEVKKKMESKVGYRKSSFVILQGLVQCLEVNYLNIIKFF